MKHDEAIDRENIKAHMRKGASEEQATKLVHLRNKKQSPKSKMSEALKAPSHREDYPYGTRVTLEGEHAKKLGLHNAKAGQKVKLHAKGHVVSVSHDHRQGEKPSHRVEVQLTHMGQPGSDPDNDGDVHSDSFDDVDGEAQD